MKMDTQTAKKIKRDFPIFKNNPWLVYLDSAATSQKPKQVMDSLVNFYEKNNANPGRSIHTLAEKAINDYANAREIAAKFIGAETKEIIFTKNATESLNLLSYTLSSIFFKGKDEILLTEMEHHSNLIPWQQLAKRNGMKLKFVRVKEDFTLDMNDLKNKLNEKTAIVAFTYVSNVFGTINPVKEMVELAKQKNVITVVDAAQAVQHMKVNVKEIGCDFLAFSSHKMLGPTGIGVLYGRKELLSKMQPWIFGGGMIKKVTFESTLFADIPEKFEAGTQNVAGAVALAEAIKYLEGIGFENIKDWENQLTKYAHDKLSKIKGIKIYAPDLKNISSILSFNIEGIHPHDVAEILNKEGIAIRAGHQCAMPLMEFIRAKGGVCRASFSFYNTFEDVDALVEGLKKIKEKFG